MSLIRLNAVTKRYDSRVILRNVFFTLSKGDRVGLIGRNGSGKTTVLKLILAQEEPTEGTVEINEGLKIGYFSQFSQLDSGLSVEEVLEGLFAEIHTLKRELDQIETSLNRGHQGADMQQLLHRQAALMEEMERRNGWTYRVQIDTVLSVLGFSPADRQRPIGQLSGGWRNRAALAQILLSEPDVLLMDEPTNYLDIEGLAWLEGWFSKRRGALIVVSHDRHFLDRVVTRIVEIENHQFQEYRGDFAQYVREKSLRLKTLQRQFEHEEEFLAFEAEAIADRREAAQDPRKALSRRLANIKKKVEPRPVDKIITGIYESLRVSQDLCQVESIAKGYDTHLLFRDLTFDLHRGERIAILGPNGCGKTTLLKLLAREECPDAGRVGWKSGIEYVYYNQVFESLDLNDTVTHAANIVGLAYYAPRKQVNRFLELLQFSEMDLKQRIGTLSGGQRARVALARCLLSGAAVVLLDEPTNHLDLPSTQVMERALVHFPGAVIVVSHDRFFIDKVATRLLIFEGQGHVRDVAGNWTIWQASMGVLAGPEQ